MKHREGQKEGQKSKRLSVRLSAQEWASIQKQAGESGMVLSDFVRARMLDTVKENKKEYRKKNKKEYREVAEQIARVGNNINQLTRWANTHKSAAEGARMIVLFSAALVELRKVSAMVMGE
jgi:hypothetical protein